MRQCFAAECQRAINKVTTTSLKWRRDHLRRRRHAPPRLCSACPCLFGLRTEEYCLHTKEYRLRSRALLSKKKRRFYLERQLPKALLNRHAKYDILCFIHPIGIWVPEVRIFGIWGFEALGPWGTWRLGDLGLIGLGCYRAFGPSGA